MILVDVPAVAGSRPVLADLLKSYGVALQGFVVVEGDSARIALNNPLYILPKMEYHDIVEPIANANLSIFVPVSQAIGILDSRRKSLTIEPLLSSTEKSWGKANYQNLPSLARADGDPSGPFTLAVAITDSSRDLANKDAKLVLVASSAFIGERYTNAMPGNAEFFLNAMGWLREKKLGISIRAKDLKSARLRIDTRTSYIISGIAAILMPLIVFIWGFVIWSRRRHL